MAVVRTVAVALPPHRVTQAAAKAAYASVLGAGARLSIFDNAGVEARHFAHPLDYYVQERPFSERNDDYIREGAALAQRAAGEALERCGLGAGDIDHLFFVTTTGLATPSLDAILCQRMKLRPGAVRHPLFGIGCAGGVAGLSRAASILKPRERALVVSVELCSQTFRSADDSLVSLVGAALFGDGAAAAVLEGDEIASGGARIVDAASELFPGTEEVMGWRFDNDGMKLVMSGEIPDVVRRLAVPAIERFRRGRPVDYWILHPGGPKVLEAYGMPESAVSASRESLRTVGNLSSAAVLFILSDVKAQPGQSGLMAAVGPGFGIEMAYLSWL